MSTRREILKKTAVLSSLSLMTQWARGDAQSDKLGAILPQRRLTRDGQMVTAFSLGGYHVGFAQDPKNAQALIEKAMELGVRFFDNARGYQKGLAEEYLGQFLTPKYREQVFIMSKSPAQTGEGVIKDLDASLKALRTDHLDLWQIHALNKPDDVDTRIKGGVVDAFLEAKAAGKARYIGFTGHVSPKTHLYFLKRLEELGVELDTCQMPLNVCDASFESFQHHVMPVLLKKEYGIIAMKTMAGGSMMGGRIDTTPEDIRTKDIPDVIAKTELTFANLHQYVYSLPISSLCSGCRFPHELIDNVKVLRELKNLNDTDRKTLEEIAQPFAGQIVENYKRVLS